MRSRTIDDSRQRPLLLWVILSLGLATRDAWLAGHGGGTTPIWLTRMEALAFALSALSGVVLLKSRASSTDQAGEKTLENATVGLGFAAVVMHGARLVIYMKKRTSR